LTADVTFENSQGPGVLETTSVGDAAVMEQVDAAGVALDVIDAVAVAFERRLEMAEMDNDADDDADEDTVDEAIDATDEADASWASSDAFKDATTSWSIHVSEELA
jgi:hypothetical protein